MEVISHALMLLHSVENVKVRLMMDFVRKCYENKNRYTRGAKWMLNLNVYNIR